MNERNMIHASIVAVAALALAASPSFGGIMVQCKGDTNGDGRSETPGVVCMHLSSGDGFITMADGKPLYIFGFSDVTGVPESEVMAAGALAANFPAPTIALDEGDKFYLSLSNVSFIKRPDLFDPHTVHWHGLPNASAIFDGLPESAIAINIGSTATYFYQANEPGTFMYHCHAEATEHMQMGMLGKLYVRPKQNKLPDNTPLAGSFVHRAGYKYAYNDGDGSTKYDVEYALQLTGFDSKFHDASETVQALPFSEMKDDYPTINGRGYPDTVNPNPLPAPAKNGGKVSQNEHALITATAGQRILLRVSNLNVTRNYTLASLGIQMEVVGLHAKLLRGPTGRSLAYKTGSVPLGSGETADIILNTAGVPPGTYYLYASELNYLSNGKEDFGGMMTEIQIN